MIKYKQKILKWSVYAKIMRAFMERGTGYKAIKHLQVCAQISQRGTRGKSLKMRFYAQEFRTAELQLRFGFRTGLKTISIYVKLSRKPLCINILNVCLNNFKGLHKYISL